MGEILKVIGLIALLMVLGLMGLGMLASCDGSPEEASPVSEGIRR